VITKQNRQPHMGQIVVVPNNAPYVVYYSHALNDASGNNNGQADFGENILMDLTLKNVGSQNAVNVQATLSTTDPKVTVTDSNDSFGDINANASSTVTNGYAFTVQSVITDQHTVLFDVSSSNGTDTWTTNFTVVLNAPELSVPSFLLEDPTGNVNNRMDPGETVSLTFSTINDGHANSPAATTTLTCASPYITIQNPTINLGAIATAQTLPSAFGIQVDPSTPIGTYVTFVFNVDASGYTASKTISLPVGLNVEDWETNTFTSFPWSPAGYGTTPWIIINSGNIYEGNYTARSGIITHSQTSIMNISVTVLTADSLSFYKKVSCEAPYSGTYYWDYLEFLIDGVSKAKWAGEVDWSREAYFLSTGAHTLTWKYLKDNSVSEGDDASWVDFIVFPQLDIASENSETLPFAQYMAVYPSPFESDFTVNFSLTQTANIDITLYDMLGRNVMTIADDVSAPAGNNVYNVSAESLPSGYYIIKLSTDKGEIKTNIVKTK